MLGYAVAARVVPVSAIYPSVGVDPSWRAGITRATAHHLAFGRDVVFTYGPYGSVLTRSYAPQLRWLPIVGGARTDSARPTLRRRAVRADDPLTIPHSRLRDVDIHTTDQSLLFVNGASWNPRPVFQSYQAYDPYLAGLNVRHLEGPTAPQHVLVSLSTVDSQLLALHDGPRLLPLLERYRLSPSASTGSARLRPAGDSTPVRPRPRPSAAGHPWADVGGADPRRPHAARIEVRPTLAGRIQNIFWRPAMLSITLTTSDGGAVAYRFVPGMAASDFILSPVIRSDPDLGAIASPGWGSAPPHVVSIQIAVEGATTRTTSSTSRCRSSR